MRAKWDNCFEIKPGCKSKQTRPAKVADEAGPLSTIGKGDHLGSADLGLCGRGHLKRCDPV
jgi:hypothetical protein